MSQIRRPLSGVHVDTAIRERICHRSRDTHHIAPGEQHLTVRNTGGVGVKNYCREHAADVLDEAEADLRRVRAELGL